MKKTILSTILAGSALVLAACGGAKSLTAEEAEAYAKEHYTATEPINVTHKQKISIKKSEGLFKFLFGEPCELETETPSYLTPIDTKEFSVVPNAKYYVESGCLKIEAELGLVDFLKMQDEGEPEIEELIALIKDPKGTEKMSSKTDDKGYLVHSETEASFSCSYMGQECSLEMTSVDDYVAIK